MGYKKNHCIVFSVKCPIISDINVNNQKLLNLSFEVLNYYRALRSSGAKRHLYTLLYILVSFQNSLSWENSTLFFGIQFAS